MLYNPQLLYRTEIYLLFLRPSPSIKTAKKPLRNSGFDKSILCGKMTDVSSGDNTTTSQRGCWIPSLAEHLAGFESGTYNTLPKGNWSCTLTH